MQNEFNTDFAASSYSLVTTRKGKRSPLQRPSVLAVATSVSKGRVPLRSTGSVEQPNELLSG